MADLDPLFERDRAMSREDLLIDFEAERDRLGKTFELAADHWTKAGYEPTEDLKSIYQYRADVSKIFHAS